MPWGLKPYYGTGGLHFITWSCHRRRPLLSEPARDLLLTVLELMRLRYRLAVVGYVIMPEHMHLLVSEPQVSNPSTVVQAVKLGLTQRWHAPHGLLSSPPAKADISCAISTGHIMCYRHLDSDCIDNRPVPEYDFAATNSSLR